MTVPDLVRPARAVAALLLVGLAVLAPAVPASAHAALVGVDPADGTELDTAPAVVTLEFNEVVTQSEVAVRAPDGSDVPVAVSARDREVSATLDGADQQGTYTVAFRVVSADGHPISGTSEFVTTSGREVEQVAAPAVDDRSFLHRHASHVGWIAGGAVVAVGLILWPLLRRERA